MLLDDLVCSIVGYLKILPAFSQARMGEAKYKRKYGLNKIFLFAFLASFNPGLTYIALTRSTLLATELFKFSNGTKSCPVFGVHET